MFALYFPLLSISLFVHPSIFAFVGWFSYCLVIFTDDVGKYKQTNILEWHILRMHTVFAWHEISCVFVVANRWDLVEENKRKRCEYAFHSFFFFCVLFFFLSCVSVCNINYSMSPLNRSSCMGGFTEIYCACLTLFISPKGKERMTHLQPRRSEDLYTASVTTCAFA